MSRILEHAYIRISCLRISCLDILAAIHDHLAGRLRCYDIALVYLGCNMIQNKLIVASKEHNQIAKSCFIGTAIHNDLAGAIGIQNMMIKLCHRVLIVFNGQRPNIQHIEKDLRNHYKIYITVNADRHILIWGIDHNRAAVISAFHHILAARCDGLTSFR